MAHVRYDGVDYLLISDRAATLIEADFARALAGSDDPFVRFQAAGGDRPVNVVIPVAPGMEPVTIVD